MSFVDQSRVVVPPDEPDPADMSGLKAGEDSLVQYEHHLLLTVQACWRLQQNIDALKDAMDNLFT